MIIKNKCQKIILTYYLIFVRIIYQTKIFYFYFNQIISYYQQRGSLNGRRIRYSWLSVIFLIVCIIAFIAMKVNCKSGKYSIEKR